MASRQLQKQVSLDAFDSATALVSRECTQVEVKLENCGIEIKGGFPVVAETTRKLAASTR